MEAGTMTRTLEESRAFFADDRFAMEACGIDVFATARAHGLEVHTLRVLGEERNHFGLILVE